jgi:hypothetical protein
MNSKEKHCWAVTHVAADQVPEFCAMSGQRDDMSFQGSVGCHVSVTI